MSDLILTTTEQSIFKLLTDTIESKAEGTVARVAGGWVRDRLLGMKSNDIDICVDNMSGAAFANLVLEHMKESGVKTSRKVTTVDANTEANKHLESAILPISGKAVDFVQLRRETYDDESRNPEIEVGVTAAEDAMRRDLTINALFYNLNTKKVEDYVNGLEHLENRVAVTPVDPIRTFLEDPLRILRVIRFAARFKLSLKPDIIEAAKDERVQKALLRKISRERIWAEFSKFMSHENFLQAVKLMKKMGLRDLLLSPTKEQLERVKKRQDKYTKKKWIEGFGDWDMDQKNPYHNLNLWSHTVAALKYLSGLEPEDRMITSVAMLFHDIGKCDACSMQTYPDGKHSFKEHELSSAIMTDEILKDLRAPNEIRTRVVKLVKNHMRLHQLPVNSKTGLRRVIRDVGREDWVNFVCMSKSDSMGKKAKGLDPKYDQFNEYALEYMDTLDGESSEVKPPLNGHEIMQLLDIKPGKAVGDVMNSLKEQLLICPEMTKDEAVEFVRSCNV